MKFSLILSKFLHSDTAKSAADARAIENYKRQQPAKVEKEERQQQNNQNPQTYNPDIVDWVRQNAWFNENSDDYDAEMAEEVKAYDLVLSRQYQRMGKADKIATKDYFKDIDNYVREKFYMETHPSQSLKLSENLLAKSRQLLINPRVTVLAK